MQRTYHLITCWLALQIVIGHPTSPAAEPFWQEHPTNTPAGLRGLAIASKPVADATASHGPSASPSPLVLWASGAKGTVIRSQDTGLTWQACGPTRYADLEFRSIHAWDPSRAVIASAGTPAIVLLTEDAGINWQEVYRDSRTEAFIDGLQFFDPHQGILFGDPYDGHFALASTRDIARAWRAHTASQSPRAVAGEAAFAASNSAMLVEPSGRVWIGTGGAQQNKARVHRSTDHGLSWQTTELDMPSDATSGIFSLARSPSGTLVAVGGDYRPESNARGTAAVSLDQGMSFLAATTPPTHFRSAVIYSIGTHQIPAGFYATGPTGTDYSADGLQWQAISSTGFHALASAPDGRLFAVGAEGRFGWSN